MSRLLGRKLLKHVIAKLGDDDKYEILVSSRQSGRKFNKGLKCDNPRQIEIRKEGAARINIQWQQGDSCFFISYEAPNDGNWTHQWLHLRGKKDLFKHLDTGINKIRQAQVVTYPTLTPAEILEKAKDGKPFVIHTTKESEAFLKTCPMVGMGLYLDRRIRPLGTLVRLEDIDLDGMPEGFKKRKITSFKIEQTILEAEIYIVGRGELANPKTNDVWIQAELEIADCYFDLDTWNCFVDLKNQKLIDIKTKKEVHATNEKSFFDKLKKDLAS